MARALTDCLAYNSELGTITWVKPGKGVQVGATAGCLNGRGYLVVKFDYKLYQAHQIAWYLTHGAWPEKSLDHVNGIKTDNRIENLRLADVSQNAGNSKKRQNTSSVYKGVRWIPRDKKWRADLGTKSGKHYLGTFNCEKDAAKAYNKAALAYFGEFANLNDLGVPNG